MHFCYLRYNVTGANITEAVLTVFDDCSFELYSMIVHLSYIGHLSNGWLLVHPLILQPIFHMRIVTVSGVRFQNQDIES